MNDLGYTIPRVRVARLPNQCSEATLLPMNQAELVSRIRSAASVRATGFIFDYVGLDVTLIARQSSSLRVPSSADHPVLLLME
jgi:hypothetical protein